MRIFNFFKSTDINQEIIEFNASGNAILLDVRTPEEYKQGHIPNSKNVPLQSISDIEKLTTNKSDKILVYCHSGARSRQAVKTLNSMGYSNAKNIGGIVSYSGRMI